MSRSVMVPADAEAVLYFYVEPEEDDEWFWDDLIANIRGEIRSEDESFTAEEDWIGRECRVIIANQVVRIAISEYCGMCSLAFVPVDEPDETVWEPLQTVWEEFAAEWSNQFADKVAKKLPGIGIDLLRRVGAFSNGEVVYEKAG